MKESVYKRIIVLLLAAAMLVCCLSGCSVYSSLTRFDSASQEGEGEVDMDISDSGEDEVDLPIGGKNDSPFEDDVFTLNYSSADPLNPITCTNRFNLLVGKLMYESLFTYNKDFEPEPVLAESWRTNNGQVWVITIKQGIYFHDGRELVAEDVLYSLRQSAKDDSGSYAGRFDSTFCEDITATGTYELTFTLGYADWDFLLMLDVPIIKVNDAAVSIPAGTGPFMYTKETDINTGETTHYLTRWDQYRDSDSIPMDKVYLREYSDENLSSAFTDGYIDLLDFDPAGISSVSVQMDHEIRYYNTTVLEYLGFNYDNSLLANEDIRRAIGHLINYEYITETIYNGKVLSSPLILSPAVNVYDPQWEEDLGVGYDLVEFSSIFASYGMSDSDGDGYLEYRQQDFKFRLVYNYDNSYKVAVAERIAATLRSVGIEVELNPCSWKLFQSNLKMGYFDMYIADVRLPADFDPTELLRTWGSMNWGGISERGDREGAYVQLCRNFVGAPTVTTVQTANPDDPEGEPITTQVTDLTARTSAALALCTYVYNTAPIIPICYKMGCVISHRNVIYNLQPSYSSVFRNLTECTVTLKDED